MAATPAFSLQGPAAGDYAYQTKPGGVDYFRGSQPITREQYMSARFLAGGIGPAASDLEASAPPAGTTAPGNPTGAGSSYTDKSDDIALNNAGLASVDNQTNSGLAAVDKALGDITGQYDTEAAAGQTKYNTSSDQNQNNLQKNKETALVNAAQGRRGLFGTLASLGALNGSGLTLANNAVQKGANDDLSGAADTYATNQNTLDSALSDFKQADKERRAAAATAAEDAKTNVRNTGLQTKQKFYTGLSADYAAEGDKGNAAKYSGLAGSLYPDIASTSIPSTNLAPTAALTFTPGSLGNYLAGGNTQVTTGGAPNPGASGVNGLPVLSAGGTDKRKLVPA